MLVFRILDHRASHLFEAWFITVYDVTFNASFSLRSRQCGLRGEITLGDEIADGPTRIISRRAEYLPKGNFPPREHLVSIQQG